LRESANPVIILGQENVIMNKALPLIAILALLAVGGFSLFFVYQGKLADTEETMQDQMLSLQEEQKRLSEIESSLRAEKEEADRLAREAMEARQMAEAQAAKEREQREQLVAELNAKLQREAQERREAETAQAELAEKIAALETAQQEAQAALAALEAEQAEQAEMAQEPTPERQELSETISSQQEQLQTLLAENRALKERQQAIEARQIETEEAIVSAGGKIDLPYPEIRSPNVRRKAAIYFKERVVGHPNP
jgi:chromosome segregation ATPase